MDSESICIQMCYKLYRTIADLAVLPTFAESKYTQTKKLRPIFMVLYLSIQLRCRNKNKTNMFIKRRTHKHW